MSSFISPTPAARVAAPDPRRAGLFALGLLVPVALLLALGPTAARADDANVALHKPTSASGSYGIYGPGRGNDDDPTTIWNGGTHEACWQVDLQGVHVIRSIVVSSNQFGASGLQTVFQVSASLDGSSWKPLGAPATGRGDQTFTFAAHGAEMRHIRYCTLPGSTNWATLGELKAYGTPVGARPPGGGQSQGRGGAVDNSDCEKRTPFGDCIISNVKTVPTNR
jgi:hypothetical protein